MAVQNINGVDLKLYANGVEIGCAQAIDLDLKTATSSAVCRGDGGWNQSVAGNHSWTASTSGLIRLATGTDAAGNVTYANFMALQIARTPVTLKFGTGITGDSVYSGTALITDNKASSPISGAATFAISFEGSGPLTTTVN